MIRFLACLCLSVGVPFQLKAWNAEGHMVVAQIAYNHLDPTVKAKCDALIAVPLGSYSTNTCSNFVTAAVWADDFKSPLGTGGWHYVDLAFSWDGTPTNSSVYDASNVVQAINVAITNLAGGTATQSNQAVSLRYLLHFVGDIQQPLHCSTAFFATAVNGDAGGNGFPINGFGNNLHSLWDRGGGYLSDFISRPLGSSDIATLASKVADVEATYPYIPNPGAVPDFMDLAREGRGLAQSVSYVGISTNSAPTTTYLNTAMATTKQRMAQGGHQLADLLTTILAPNPARLAASIPAKGKFQLTWSAIPGRNYRVQWKGRLETPAWTDLTNFNASSNSAFYGEAVGATQHYYRVLQ